MYKAVKINNTTLEDSQLGCEFNRVKNESIKANFISHCVYKTIGKKFVEFQCGVHDGVYKIKANEIDLNGGKNNE